MSKLADLQTLDMCALPGCDRPGYAYSPSGYCHRHHYDEREGRPLRVMRARPWSRDELVAEVEHLLGTDSGDGIAARLNLGTRSHLARRLQRAGRPDLAQRIIDTGIAARDQTTRYDTLEAS